MAKNKKKETVYTDGDINNGFGDLSELFKSDKQKKEKQEKVKNDNVDNIILGTATGEIYAEEENVEVDYLRESLYISRQLQNSCVESKSYHDIYGRYIIPICEHLTQVKFVNGTIPEAKLVYETLERFIVEEGIEQIEKVQMLQTVVGILGLPEYDESKCEIHQAHYEDSTIKNDTKTIRFINSDYEKSPIGAFVYSIKAVADSIIPNNKNEFKTDKDLRDFICSVKDLNKETTSVREFYKLINIIVDGTIIEKITNMNDIVSRMSVRFSISKEEITSMLICGLLNERPIIGAFLKSQLEDMSKSVFKEETIERFLIELSYNLSELNKEKAA